MASRISERWLSGRKRRFAKPVRGPKSPPRVRIPSSPLACWPMSHKNLNSSAFAFLRGPQNFPFGAVFVAGNFSDRTIALTLCQGLEHGLELLADSFLVMLAHLVGRQVRVGGDRRLTHQVLAEVKEHAGILQRGAEQVAEVLDRGLPGPAGLGRDPVELGLDLVVAQPGGFRDCGSRPAAGGHGPGQRPRQAWPARRLRRSEDSSWFGAGCQDGHWDQSPGR